jgi:hypothetical protein
MLNSHSHHFMFYFCILDLVEAVELRVQLERMKSMFGLSARMKGEFDE